MGRREEEKVGGKQLMEAGVGVNMGRRGISREEKWVVNEKDRGE